MKNTLITTMDAEDLGNVDLKPFAEMLKKRKNSSFSNGNSIRPWSQRFGLKSGTGYFQGKGASFGQPAYCAYSQPGRP